MGQINFRNEVFLFHPVFEIEHQKIPKTNFDSLGLLNYSSFDDNPMINFIEEQKVKNDMAKRDKKEEKKNTELLAKIPKDNTEMKEDNKNDNIINFIELDKVTTTKNNIIYKEDLLNKKEIIPKNDTTKATSEKTNIYKEVKKINETIPKKLLNKKRKRGPKIKENEKPKKNLKINNMFSDFNLSRKIKSNFLNFCVDFSNELIENYKTELNNYDKKLIKLNRKFKILINKKEDKSLKEKNLGQIINAEISSKNKNSNIHHNKNIYKEEIQKNEALKEIFSIEYKTLFNIYYKSEKIINLKDCRINEEILQKYKLNKDIKLSENVKMFNDLLENNSTYKDFIKENNVSMAEEYKNELNNFAIRKFSLNSIKFCITKIK